MLSLINGRFRKNAKRFVPFSVLIFAVELFVEIPKIDGHRKLILAIPSMGKLVWFVVQIVCVIQIFVVGCLFMTKIIQRFYREKRNGYVMDFKSKPDTCGIL